MIDILTQDTPNPNARKYILNQKVKSEGKISYSSQKDCYNNILAHDLLGIAHVSAIHFFDNVITITQDGMADWDNLDWLARAIIETRMPIHNPDFKEKPDEILRPKKTDPELEKMEAILDATIRPGLQMDGGDIELLSLENKVLRVQYMGACGSCPSSSMGTLQAIQGILQDQYDPELQVVIA